MGRTSLTTVYVDSNTLQRIDTNVNKLNTGLTV